jgi:hypothetical protein
VWRLKDDDGVLDCAVRYSRSRDHFERGGTLRRTDCSRYFAAMLSRRVISAEDAVHDPKTAELASYLRAEGIGALLDAPIYRDGAVIGIVCHEHCGGTRRWTENEATFASAVADMLTILVEQAELAELRAALEQERHAQARADKMVALQRLGRVLAHDLNNVLMVAMSRNEVHSASTSFARRVKACMLSGRPPASLARQASTRSITSGVTPARGAGCVVRDRDRASAKDASAPKAAARIAR